MQKHTVADDIIRQTVKMEQENIEFDLNSSLDEYDLENLEKASVPKNTLKATVYGMKKFVDWITKRGKTCDFHSISAADLNVLLRKFYAEVSFNFNKSG